MKAISTLFMTILVFSIFLLGFSETSLAGFFPPPPNPVCCANNNICADNSLGPFLCPIGSEIVEGALCDANGECSPVIVPLPEAKNVPALSSWGFMALGVGLAILALGALLIRRRKQHS